MEITHLLRICVAGQSGTATPPSRVASTQRPGKRNCTRGISLESDPVRDFTGQSSGPRRGDRDFGQRSIGGSNTGGTSCGGSEWRGRWAWE
ncbi:unnamed protein product [Arctia plantaginis]|uniref:Uncharacterized protein n=1 Tax=Arctia plantaginis TaxID=874455 RepID=A0A8S1BGX8_ARCPL|nr:unnamed protein product [Arctia plantaginis]